MRNLISKKHLKYVGKFSLVYVLMYSLVAVLFVLIKNNMGVSQTIALDFFKSYSFPDLKVIFEQLIKGLVIAIIILPFYELIIKNKYSVILLFLTIWGLMFIGSVQPMPGSIEGMYYTKTTVIEHLLVIVANMIQIILFSIIFFKWEKGKVIKESEVS